MVSSDLFGHYPRGHPAEKMSSPHEYYESDGSRSPDSFTRSLSRGSEPDHRDVTEASGSRSTLPSGPPVLPRPISPIPEHPSNFHADGDRELSISAEAGPSSGRLPRAPAIGRRYGNGKLTKRQYKVGKYKKHVIRKKRKDEVEILSEMITVSDDEDCEILQFVTPRRRRKRIASVDDCQIVGVVPAKKVRERALSSEDDYPPDTSDSADRGQISGPKSSPSSSSGGHLSGRSNPYPMNFGPALICRDFQLFLSESDDSPDSVDASLSDAEVIEITPMSGRDESHPGVGHEGSATLEEVEQGVPGAGEGEAGGPEVPAQGGGTSLLLERAANAHVPGDSELEEDLILVDVETVSDEGDLPGEVISVGHGVTIAQEEGDADC